MVGKYDVDPVTGMKTCSRCSEEKLASDDNSVSAFGKNKASRDGFKYFCKECVNAEQRAWAKANPERVAAARVRQRDRRNKAYDLLRAQESQAEPPSE